MLYTPVICTLYCVCAFVDQQLSRSICVHCLLFVHERGKERIGWDGILSLLSISRVS